MPLNSLAAKLTAFNFNVLEVDGHNLGEIKEAYERAKVTFEKPTAIILRTIPGKGVDFMENEPGWHGKVPSPAEEILALAELKKMINAEMFLVNDLTKILKIAMRDGYGEGLTEAGKRNEKSGGIGRRFDGKHEDGPV